MNGERRRQRPPAPPRPAEEARGEIVRLRSRDGILLAVRIFRAPQSPRLPFLCLPGLSRNSRDFTGLGHYFSQHPAEPRRVLAVDYRGRGLSDPDRNWRNYTPTVEAEDVLTAATALGVDKAILIGTSRGGIIAMLLGALRPGLIAGAVLNDIGPVLEGTGLARIKKSLQGTRPVPGWSEAAAIMRSNGGAQFPGISDTDWQAAARAYFAEAKSGLAPQFDRNLLRSVGDMDFSEKAPVLWPQFASLARVPVLAIRGEFSDILSAETVEEMAERHPDFDRLTVPGQGHAPLLRDLPTLERILALARRCDSRPG